jgi:hypothetical protein
VLFMTTTQFAAAPTTASQARAYKVLVKLHSKRTSRQVRRAFDKLDADTQEAITEPCLGEAHSNPHIDYCMCCMGFSWGRSLKRLAANH